MGNQLGLWDLYTRPRARASDPLSSHAAADRAEATGLIGKHHAAVLRLVLRHPGLTAKELEQHGELTKVEIGRRTKELEEHGWITRSSTRAGEELRLWPTENARAWAGRTGSE